MRFIFDNNFPVRLSRALNALSEHDGDTVDHIRNRNLHAVPDEEYVLELAKDGEWIVVTADIALSRKPQVIQAWISSGFVFVILKNGWIKLEFWPKAWKLIRIWPEIREKALSAEPGTGISVPVRGPIRFINPSGAV